MSDETSIERWLTGALARVSTPRGAVVAMSTATIAVTVIAGTLMRAVDRENFGSLGAGIWWAAQTVTTVGYGDHVPETVGGRLAAVLVMLLGIGFVTVITAVITSTFVQRAQREREASAAVDTADVLKDIAGRLERIEAALNRPS
jgi:voltage-gated potassium channel